MTIYQQKIGKAIAILLVVFGHLGFIYKGGAIGVSIFLALSGYGVTKRYIQNKENLKGFWKRRIETLYFPYLLFQIVVVFFLLLIKPPFFADLNSTTILLSILGHPQNAYDPTMWYVSFILLMYFVVYISFSIGNNTQQKAYMSAMLCLFSGVLSYFIYSRSVSVYLYVFSFPAGILFEIFENKLMSYIRKIPKTVFLFLIVGFIVTLDCLSSISVIIYEALTVGTSLFVIPFLIIITDNNLITLKGSQLIVILGESSFAVYLIEGIIMRVIWEIIGTKYNFWIGWLIVIIGIIIHLLWKNCTAIIRSAEIRKNPYR